MSGASGGESPGLDDTDGSKSDEQKAKKREGQFVSGVKLNLKGYSSEQIEHNKGGKQKIDVTQPRKNQEAVMLEMDSEMKEKEKQDNVKDQNPLINTEEQGYHNNDGEVRRKTYPRAGGNETGNGTVANEDEGEKFDNEFDKPDANSQDSQADSEVTSDIQKTADGHPVPKPRQSKNKDAKVAHSESSEDYEQKTVERIDAETEDRGNDSTEVGHAITKQDPGTKESPGNDNEEKNQAISKAIGKKGTNSLSNLKGHCEGDLGNSGANACNANFDPISVHTNSSANAFQANSDGNVHQTNLDAKSIQQTSQNANPIKTKAEEVQTNVDESMRQEKDSTRLFQGGQPNTYAKAGQQNAEGVGDSYSGRRENSDSKKDPSYSEEVGSTNSVQDRGQESFIVKTDTDRLTADSCLEEKPMKSSKDENLLLTDPRLQENKAVDGASPEDYKQTERGQINLETAEQRDESTERGLEFSKPLQTTCNAEVKEVSGVKGSEENYNDEINPANSKAICNENSNLDVDLESLSAESGIKNPDVIECKAKSDPESRLTNSGANKCQAESDEQANPANPSNSDTKSSQQTTLDANTNKTIAEKEVKANVDENDDQENASVRILQGGHPNSSAKERQTKNENDGQSYSEGQGTSNSKQDQVYSEEIGLSNCIQDRGPQSIIEKADPDRQTGDSCLDDHSLKSAKGNVESEVSLRPKKVEKTAEHVVEETVKTKQTLFSSLTPRARSDGTAEKETYKLCQINNDWFISRRGGRTHLIKKFRNISTAEIKDDIVTADGKYYDIIEKENGNISLKQVIAAEVEEDSSMSSDTGANAEETVSALAKTNLHTVSEGSPETTKRDAKTYWLQMEVHFEKRSKKYEIQLSETKRIKWDFVLGNKKFQNAMIESIMKNSLFIKLEFDEGVVHVWPKTNTLQSSNEQKELDSLWYDLQIHFEEISASLCLIVLKNDFGVSERLAECLKQHETVKEGNVNIHFSAKKSLVFLVSSRDLLTNAIRVCLADDEMFARKEAKNTVMLIYPAEVSKHIYMLSNPELITSEFSDVRCELRMKDNSLTVRFLGYQKCPVYAAQYFNETFNDYSHQTVKVKEIEGNESLQKDTVITFLKAQMERFANDPSLRKREKLRFYVSSEGVELFSPEHGDIDRVKQNLKKCAKNANNQLDITVKDTDNIVIVRDKSVVQSGQTIAASKRQQQIEQTVNGRTEEFFANSTSVTGDEKESAIAKVLCLESCMTDLTTQIAKITSDSDVIFKEFEKNVSCQNSPTLLVEIYSDDSMASEESTHNVPKDHRLQIIHGNENVFWKDLLVQIVACNNYKDKPDKPFAPHLKTQMQQKQLFVPVVQNNSTDKHAVYDAVANLMKEASQNSCHHICITLNDLGECTFKVFFGVILKAVVQHLANKGGDLPVTVAFLTQNKTDFETMITVASQKPVLKIQNFTRDGEKKMARLLEIEVVEGKLTDQQADIYVNAASKDLTLENGNISNSLLKAAGIKLQQECRQKYPSGVEDWEIAVTEGYDLKCELVFHGALKRFENQSSVQKIEQLVFDCLERASKLGKRNIAFPPIGTGKLGFTSNQIADCLVGAVQKFNKKHQKGSLQKVYMVVLSGDKSVNAFKDMEKNYKKNCKLERKPPRPPPINKKTITQPKSKIFKLYNTDVSVCQGTLETFVESREVAVCLCDNAKWKTVFNNSKDLFVTTCNTFGFKKVIHVPCNVGDVFMACRQGIKEAEKEKAQTVVFYIESAKNFSSTSQSFVQEYINAIQEISSTLVNSKRFFILLVKEQQCKLSIEDAFEEFMRRKKETGGNESKSLLIKYKVEGQKSCIQKAIEVMKSWKPQDGFNLLGVEMNSEIRTLQSSNLVEPQQMAMSRSTSPESKPIDEVLKEADEKSKVHRYLKITNLPKKSTYQTLKELISKHCPHVNNPEVVYLAGQPEAYIICETRKDADLMASSSFPELCLKKLNKQVLSSFKVTGKMSQLERCGNKETFLHELKRLDAHFSQNNDEFLVEVATSYQLRCMYEILRKIQPDASVQADTQDEFEIIVPHIEGVTDEQWAICENEKGDLIKKFNANFGTINFSGKTMHFEGMSSSLYCEESKSILKDLEDFVKYLKSLEFDEIAKDLLMKKTSAESIEEIVRTSGNGNATFIKSKNKVVTYGRSYEDAKKVRHRILVSLGIVKPTGRKKTTENTNSNDNDQPQNFYHRAQKKSVDFQWERDTSLLETYKTSEGIQIYVYKADITNIPVDCIVNAANETLQHGGGVAAVISKSAGKSLDMEGDQFIKSHGLIKVGMNVATTAGNLPYQKVIHAVGPRWSSHKPYSYEDVQACEENLYQTIYNSLETTEKLGLTSVGIPAISSAIFGVPIDLCVCQYVKATLNYSKDRPVGKGSLLEIHFIDINPKVITAIQDEFKTVLVKNDVTQYDRTNHVISRHGTGRRDTSAGKSCFSSSQRYDRKRHSQAEQNKFYPSRELDTWLSPVEIYFENGHCFAFSMEPLKRLLIYKGDVTGVNSAVLVMTIDEYGNLNRIANKVFDSLAPSMQPVYKNALKKALDRKGKHVGQVVSTKGFGTMYTALLHVVTPKPGQMKKHTREENLNRAFCNVLTETLALKEATALALPLFGIDYTKTDETEMCANAFLNGFGSYLQKQWRQSNSMLDTVHFVCQTQTNVDTVYSTFKKHFEIQVKEASKKKDDTVIAESVQPGIDVIDDCVICMDKVENPRRLKCGHIFCADCIRQHFDIKKTCPTCGHVCGIIEGDQPDGVMKVSYSSMPLSGYPDCGQIIITYDIFSGRQKANHPNPGQFYNGIRRMAYLPDNLEGQTVLKMLRVAFDRKLVFTIGRSRTTGQEGVVTWNDIHHKTDWKSNSQFGYPDPTYLARVKDELAAKGVTEEDIE